MDRTDSETEKLNKFRKAYLVISMGVGLLLSLSLLCSINNFEIGITGKIFMLWIPVSLLSCALFAKEKRAAMLSPLSYCAYILINYIWGSENSMHAKWDLLSIASFVFGIFFCILNGYFLRAPAKAHH